MRPSRGTRLESAGQAMALRGWHLPWRDDARPGHRPYGDGMTVLNGWRRQGRSGNRAVDALGVAVLCVLSVVAASVDPHEHEFVLRWSAVVLAIVGCSALIWRRRHPFGVLVVAVGCGVAFQVLGFRESPLVTSPVLVSVYNVAVLTDRRTAWTAAAASAAVMVGAVAVWSSNSWLDPDKAAMLAWTALPAAVGDGLRSRRAYVAAVEERAEQAERTREQEAQQRVAAERVRSHASCTTSSRTTSP